MGLSTLYKEMALPSLLPHISLPPSLPPSDYSIKTGGAQMGGRRSRFRVMLLAVGGRCPSPSSQVARTRKERLIIWGPNHKSVVPEFRFAVHACMAATDATAQKSPSSVEWWRRARAAPLSRRVVRLSLTFYFPCRLGWFLSLPPSPSLSLSPLVLPHDVRPRVRPCVAPRDNVRFV